MRAQKAWAECHRDFDSSTVVAPADSASLDNFQPDSEITDGISFSLITLRLLTDKWSQSPAGAPVGAQNPPKFGIGILPIHPFSLPFRGLPTRNDSFISRWHAPLVVCLEGQVTTLTKFFENRFTKFSMAGRRRSQRASTAHIITVDAWRTCVTTSTVPSTIQALSQFAKKETLVVLQIEQSLLSPEKILLVAVQKTSTKTLRRLIIRRGA